MRLGFVITGVGAACVFTVVSSRMTLGLQNSTRLDFAADQRAQTMQIMMQGGVLSDAVYTEDTELATLPGPIGPLAKALGALEGPPGGRQLLLDGSRSNLGTGFGGGGAGGGSGGGSGSGSSGGDGAAASSDSETTPTPPAPTPENQPPGNPPDGLTAFSPPSGGGSGGGGVSGPLPPPPGPPGPTLPGPTVDPSVFTPPPPPPTPPGPPLPPVVTVPSLGGGGPPPSGPLSGPTIPDQPSEPSAAPEPSIWLSLTLGLGAVGAMLRRRRRPAMAVRGGMI